MSNDRETRWTCIICRVKPDEIEFASLQKQELNQKVAFVVDSNYRQITFQVRGRKDGKVITLKANESLHQMITSKHVSPEIKQLIINGLIHDQTLEHTENTSVTTEPILHTSSVAKSSGMASHTLSDRTTAQSSVQRGLPTLFQSSTRKRCHDIPDSQEDTSGSNFKVWKENEEKLLIDNRRSKDENFRSSRNHTEIWKEIADHVNTTLNSHVTHQQCMHKYNSLKKKWKEIIDLPSGSEPKYFSHREEFDQFYGTKASTKPKHTVDTDNPDGAGNKQKETQKSKTPKKSSQKSYVSTLLEKQHTEFLNTMTKMHNEKMEKFDKFLEVFSNMKNNN